jgi:IS30 family transposase
MVTATFPGRVEVVVGSRVWFGQDDRDRFIALVCSGTPLAVAARQVGVSRPGGTKWWRKAGAMELVKGHGGGIAGPGRMDGPSGPGHPLSLDERIEIQIGLRQHDSIATIAAALGRDRTVVWREVRRNSGPDGTYYAGTANARAAARAKRPKPFKIISSGLSDFITENLKEGWSPKLISDVLAKEHGNDVSMQISHETIYKCLYVQTRGQLRKDLSQYLSLKRTARVPRDKTRDKETRGRFNDALKISERPAEAEDRAVPGHWEGDLIIGAGGKSAIGTLVERTTRFTILLHLPLDHGAEAVTAAMIAQMKDLPEHLRRTVTWDRGPEIAGYAQIRMELDAPVYLCDPHSPWQRGTNENTNRLLRHWFEKGSDLSEHTAADLKRIQDSLNRRPRPTLDLETPAQRLNQLLFDQAA